MARARKATYSHRYRQPSLLNTLLFKAALLPPFTPSEYPMPTSRRNLFVRAIGTICADLTVGAAIASVAVWIIESAALGLFLSFIVWMIGTLLALALSQYVVHPAASVLLSDRKLDLAFDAMGGLGDTANRLIQSVLGRVKAA